MQISFFDNLYFCITTLSKQFVSLHDDTFKIIHIFAKKHKSHEKRDIQTIDNGKR